MKRKHLDFTIWEKEALRDPRLREEYEKLQPEFAAIEAVLRARKEKGLRQQDIAKKIGTKQSVISRLEAGGTNPTVSFLQRLAEALDTRLEIRFVPK